MTDITAVFEREQAGLAASTPPQTDELLGTVLADVPLIDTAGDAIQLSAVIDRQAVLVLYSGAWCPFCNLALRTYQQDLVPELAERGVSLSRSARSSRTGRSRCARRTS